MFAVVVLSGPEDHVGLRAAGPLIIVCPPFVVGRAESALRGRWPSVMFAR